MAGIDTASERFIRLVHRRFVVLRALERGGVGLLWGCAVATPLVLAALWQGRPALMPVAFALTIGAGAGLAWGILRRPGTLEAAMEADRQLRLADLLSTTVSTRRSDADPWVQAVQRMADARCAHLSPRSVILNRLGARSWGGIGVAAALVIALGLLPVYPSESRAGAPRSSSAVRSQQMSLEPREKPGGTVFESARHNLIQPDVDDEDSTRGGSDETNPSAVTERPAATDPAHSAETPGVRASGQGTGASHTEGSQGGNQRSPRGTDSGTASAEGEQSGGIGRPSLDASTGDRPVRGGSGSASAPTGRTPPWRSSAWPADVERARQAINNAQVPDAYRDVVRQYFKPQ